MNKTVSWIRRREHPLAKRLYSAAKWARRADLPVIPGFHHVLFIIHRTIIWVISEALRVLYWTPLFRTRLKGSHRRLHLAGGGMPLVTGPLDIFVGDDCRLSSAMTISGRPSSVDRPLLKIGKNVGIGWQTTLCVGSRVILEDNVRIAGRAFLAGYPGHPLDAEARATGAPDTDDQVGEIILRRDAWLGTGCIVSPGVEVGAGTIVAAGSVVTKSLPPGVLAAGVPARVLRPIAAGGPGPEPDNVLELKAL